MFFLCFSCAVCTKHFHAVHLKKFELAVAFLSEQSDIIKFVIGTHLTGIACRPMSQILNKNENISPDSVLIIGLIPQHCLSTVHIEVFGNGSWVENNGNITLFSRRLNENLFQNLSIDESLKLH